MGNPGAGTVVKVVCSAPLVVSDLGPDEEQRPQVSGRRATRKSAFLPERREAVGEGPGIHRRAKLLPTRVHRNLG